LKLKLTIIWTIEISLGVMPIKERWGSDRLLSLSPSLWRMTGVIRDPRRLPFQALSVAAL